jgi:tRNA dimethylallyltransferase
MLPNSFEKPTVIVVTGPTASGKTSIALALAQKFDTSIVSVDSRQCYKELNIGVAKPTLEELSLVNHYFINSHSIHEIVDAVVFEKYAIAAVEEIFLKNNVAIVCGGTGLYLNVFCEGIDDIPKTPPELRAEIIAFYQNFGFEYLHAALLENDPEFLLNSSEINNPARLMRALEVKKFTGKSILSFREGVKKQRNFDIIKLGIDLPRETLYRQINTRVDKMMEDGLLKEVSTLLQYKHLPALQTVGYTELFEFIDGKVEKSFAIEKIKQHTRNYAKRQITWFKKDQSIQWIKNPNEWIDLFE